MQRSTKKSNQVGISKLEDLLVARRRQISNVITAEKNRRRGKTNSAQADINEHIEWLEKRLEEIESKIQKLAA
jgi:transposase